jgi:hypothetical protein
MNVVLNFMYVLIMFYRIELVDTKIIFKTKEEKKLNCTNDG